MQNLAQYLAQSTDPQIQEIKQKAAIRNMLAQIGGGPAPQKTPTSFDQNYTMEELSNAKNIQNNNFSNQLLSRLKNLEGQYTPEQIQKYYITQIKPQVERQYGMALPDTYSGNAMAYDPSVNIQQQAQKQNINVNSQQGLLTGLKNNITPSQPAGFAAYATYGAQPAKQEQTRGMDFSFNTQYLTKY